MSNNIKKNNHMKQILTIFVILVTVAISNIVVKNNTINEDFNNIVSYEIYNIPEYDNKPYVIINNNKPIFEEKYFNSNCFESYSNLDNYGRCGVTFANLGKDTMPKDDESRTSISHIEPTGWNNKEYDMISGRYLYNRCHLIAHSLSAENANKKNLITGTKYLNTNMTKFESEVLEYLKEDESNHVLYRVTPIYKNDNLVASGVQMEAISVKDLGKSICFNVYLYNVQPGINIDYKTGNSSIL